LNGEVSFTQLLVPDQAAVARLTMRRRRGSAVCRFRQAIVQTIPALLAAAQLPGTLVVPGERCGLKLSQAIAIRICGGCRLRMYRRTAGTRRPLAFLMCA
jgi:hypothetical protein